ncbi:hypothetical protein [Halomonas sp. BN3-1]|uniref:hypothetical protein n=1 Tax=Halomonas sp. BN3-1 TaxID=2082393 RepID=UPI000D3D8C13|nr:hypothetical protein [Halomonas sp. BN3-1]
MSLRRGYGIAYCAQGTHWVAESQMTAYEGGHTVRLKVCRGCQIGKVPRTSRQIQDILRRVAREQCA